MCFKLPVVNICAFGFLVVASFVVGPVWVAVSMSLRAGGGWLVTAPLIAMFGFRR